MTFWVAGAVVGSALLGSDASNSTANKQADAAHASDATQRYFYDTTRADNMPLLNARNNALASYQGLLSNPSSLTNDPSYQFELGQGQTAIDRSAASRGGLYSGATLKALERFGQNTASTKLDAALGRYSTLAGLGQPGAAAISSAGMNAANQISGNQQALGNAMGANALNQGNIWGNAFNQLGAYGSRNGWFSGGSGGGGIDPNGYLGGAASAGDYSDERLKTNIRPIGRTARGNMLYAWDWKTGGSGQGVIAQEVAHIPGAVHSDADGLLMVDYTKV